MSIVPPKFSHTVQTVMQNPIRMVKERIFNISQIRLHCLESSAQLTILCNGQLSSSNSFNIALYPALNKLCSLCCKYSVPVMFFEPTVHISLCINCIDYGIGVGIEGTE